MALSGNSTPTPSYNTGYNYSAPQGGGNIQGFNPDLTNTFGTQNQNAQGFNQNQANTVNAFQGAMQSSVNALPTYQALNQANNAAYNVQPLMQNATNLNNEMLRLPSENYNMTAGSDTNQGQLDQMTGVQQFRLQPLAQNATAQAQQAQNLSNQATGYGIQNENFQISPYTTAAPMVQSTLASAASNFGAQQQAELQALTDKMNQGVTLTTDERDNLNRLQVAQTNYNSAVATANITANAALKYQNLAPGATLYNTTTTGHYTAP